MFRLPSLKYEERTVSISLFARMAEMQNEKPVPTSLRVICVKESMIRMRQIRE